MIFHVSISFGKNIRIYWTRKQQTWYVFYIAVVKKREICISLYRNNRPLICIKMLITFDWVPTRLAGRIVCCSINNPLYNYIWLSQPYATYYKTHKRANALVAHQSTIKMCFFYWAWYSTCKLNKWYFFFSSMQQNRNPIKLNCNIIIQV
jgi:hypothetical protein